MLIKPLLPHSMTNYLQKLYNMQISDALNKRLCKCSLQFLLKQAEFKDKLSTFI